MPILQVTAEGVGPFERLDLDLSDGNGRPHLGPHIVVGVNGSGKSTLLRTIAWVFSRLGFGLVRTGFDLDHWRHMLPERKHSRAAIELEAGPGVAWHYVCGRSSEAELRDWSGGLFPGGHVWKIHSETEKAQEFTWLSAGDEAFNGSGGLFFLATYSPNANIEALTRPDFGKKLEYTLENALAFGRTVDSEVFQSWLMRAYSARAIAKVDGVQVPESSGSIECLSSALEYMFEHRFRISVRPEPFELRFESDLGPWNLSQLPDGLRSTIGWCADFLMRRENMRWNDALAGRKPSILIIDEVETHLHPHWQRRILPGLRKALPDTQIIVTTHSPFVASSCADARLHVLERHDNGPTTVRTEDAPFGQQLRTTLAGVFGVESRFDLTTERELNEWYQLKRRGAEGSLASPDRERLDALSGMLSARSEDLRAIVGGPERLRPETVASLVKQAGAKGLRSR